MEESIVCGLVNYEKDFLSFQRELLTLRETEPNRFVAFKNGHVVATGISVDEVKKDLEFKNIEPSSTVIEFVSEKEIRVIV